MLCQLLLLCVSVCCIDQSGSSVGKTRLHSVLNTNRRSSNASKQNRLLCLTRLLIPNIAVSYNYGICLYVIDQATATPSAENSP